MTDIHQSLKTSTCWFCHQQVASQSVNNQTISVKYICNHSPISVEWWYTRQGEQGCQENWIVDIISIILPEQFMLQFAEPSNLGDKNNGIFYLFEWKSSEYPYIGQWKSVRDNDGYDKVFPSTYILNQPIEKILSILNMYKIFS